MIVNRTYLDEIGHVTTSFIYKGIVHLYISTYTVLF